MNKILRLPITIALFFRSIGREIKQVDFPTKKETFSTTNIVIVISILFTLMLLGLDVVFSYARAYLSNN